MSIDEELLESMKGKSREERTAFFLAHKTELLDDEMLKVNGGAAGGYTNPNSDVPDANGNYWTSWGFICKGTDFEISC